MRTARAARRETLVTVHYGALRLHPRPAPGPPSPHSPGPTTRALRDCGGGFGCSPSTVGVVHEHLPPGLPPDPFAGDPADPAAAFDSPEPAQPLDAHERLAVEEDLADLAVYEALLGHRGVRGLVIACEDCHDDHFHDWEMLRANLMQLLVDGSVRPHEPAFDPQPEDYVTWDYCRGYADAAMNDASLFSDGHDI
ncbi:hypothetical protein GCM10023353_09140 [Tomitella cavernea]|uniref:DUF5319 domain-containing protein n=1 Tax=Tomitella cavernea TaxID=1387982 RepID=A0ABP9CBQ1_9ACTN